LRFVDQSWIIIVGIIPLLNVKQHAADFIESEVEKAATKLVGQSPDFLFLRLNFFGFQFLELNLGACHQFTDDFGHVFGNPSVLPVTYEQLAAEYATVLKQLTVNPEALAVFQENRALRVKDVPMEDLVRATAGLLDPEVADVFGIDRSAAVEFPRIDLAAVTEDDLLPLACLSR